MRFIVSTCTWHVLTLCSMLVQIEQCLDTFMWLFLFFSLYNIGMFVQFWILCRCSYTNLHDGNSTHTNLYDGSFTHINLYDTCHLVKLIHVIRTNIQITCHLHILDLNYIHFSNDKTTTKLLLIKTFLPIKYTANRTQNYNHIHHKIYIN